MFNNKGSTLIESLFAFQIYISIVVLFVVLLTQLYDGENRLKFYRYNQNGFTLIEVLFSLSITLLIILSLTPIYQLFSHSKNITRFDEDIYIAAKQVSQYLLGSYYIDLEDGYHYLSFEQKETYLIFDKHRLVKKDGYEIILNNIDSLKFEIKEAMVYMKLRRKERHYYFLIGYAREQENNEIIE